jgi:hypothetical protein
VDDASTLALSAGVVVQAAKTVLVKRTSAAVMNFIFFMKTFLVRRINRFTQNQYTVNASKQIETNMQRTTD